MLGWRWRTIGNGDKAEGLGASAREIEEVLPITFCPLQDAMAQLSLKLPN